MERTSLHRHLKSSLPFARRPARACRWLLCALAGICLIYLVLPGVSRPKYANFPFAADLSGNSFLIRGKPVQIMSGAIHYFRVLPKLWEDRLRTMQAAGLNAIETPGTVVHAECTDRVLRKIHCYEACPDSKDTKTATYVEWSSHEPEEGRFEFGGQQDIVRFLGIAHRLGLMVILRPGPYICAERDFGGLPYWLLRNGTSIRLRTMDKKYLFYADRYLKKVYEKVRPLLINNGGPIIMVQVENEYGSFSACDSAYMAHLRDLAWAQLGRDVTLFTVDVDNDNMLKCGAVQGTLTTVDFGTGVDPRGPFARKRRHQKAGPLINSEMYTGWLDHWGEQHHVVNASLLARRIRTVLAMKASFNLYMFHGGTNFGFKTGANLENGFRPQPTSYDYDAPINEAGDATPKLKAIRDVIAEFFPDRAKRPIPAPKQKMALGKLALKRMFGLKEMRQLMRNLSVKSPYPLTFERVGHGYGYMLYETRLSFQPPAPSLLKLHGVRDRGYVYLDDTFRGIVSRTDGVFEVFIEAKAQQTLSILVENQGRINYGDFIADPKGIVENVTLDERTLTDWKMMPLDLSKGNWLRDAGALEKIHRQGGRSVHVHNDGLSVYATTFALPESQTARDSFLRLSHWTKGVAFLNGFNLGRYWTPAGPQKTLYVPGVLFKQKDNILLIMELEVTRSASVGYCSVQFVDEPNINASVRWPL